tara:strand:- start:3261 stop:3827 length:567 start_codon:yes stop_codon:yes gene_type:complete
MTTDQWFPLPLYQYTCESIRERKDAESDLKLTEFEHREGWSKDTHRLTPNPFGSNVLEHSPNMLNFIKKHVNEYLTNIGIDESPYRMENAWFTSTQNGQYAHLHSHGGADISGVYYISTNSKDGNIYFHNPQYVMESNFMIAHLNMARQITPKKGMIVLWPSFLMHGTRVNETDHNRISLSFNLIFNR